MFRSARLRGPLAVLLLGTLLLPGCSVNPATGRQQINFYSQEEEIELGREADEEIVASVGLYDDPELQAYVESLGRRLAAQSERPDLPWSFKVVDDPAVNAFALPGGYVYVTRGLLTHLESEAELAAVLGHEIGHVTARHGVNQISKQMLALAGLGLAVLLAPEMEDLAGAASIGVSVLFLKHGRDDERQADDLGLRYVVRSGHDPNRMPEVFTVLEGVARVEGAGRLPSWLSTHPDPGARRDRIRQEVTALDGDFSRAVVNQDGYLAYLDGMIFGENPREGFFRGRVFLHPDMRFRVELPDGWETANEKSAVSAGSPGEDAFLQISLSDKETIGEAAEEFFAQEGLTRGESWPRRVHGLSSQWSRFDYSDGESELRGTVAFVQHEGKIFQLLALATPEAWEEHESALDAALASFARLDDPQVLDVRPNRVRLVKLKREMTLEQFDREHPSVVEMETLALINHCQPADRLPAGRLVKQVVEDRAR